MLVNTHIHSVVIAILLITGLSTSAQTWPLEKCIDSAKMHNKNLQISRNIKLITDLKSKESKANLIPKLILNSEYKYFTNLPYQLMPQSTFNTAAPEGQFKEAQFGVPHNLNANLQLSIPLYNPQLYGAIQITEIQKEISELHYQKNEEQIYFEISNLYYNAQILQQQILFIDSNIINTKKLLNNSQLLFNQLLIKGTDVKKTQLQLDQKNLQKEILNSKYQQVLKALKFHIGISDDSNLQIDSVIKFQDIIELNSSKNIDLEITKVQNRVLKSEVNTYNKSRYIPSFSFVGVYGSSGFGYDKQPNDFLKFYPIGFAGIQLSYPIFNGTITSRKIDQKQIELNNNELQFSIQNEQNKMLIQNARNQKDIAKKTIETTKQQIELAKTIYKQTLLQQINGIASLTEVLMADNTLHEAQQSYLTAVVEYLKADLELKKLTGNISTKTYN